MTDPSGLKRNISLDPPLINLKFSFPSKRKWCSKKCIVCESLLRETVLMTASAETEAAHFSTQTKHSKPLVTPLKTRIVERKARKTLTNREQERIDLPKL